MPAFPRLLPHCHKPMLKRGDCVGFVTDVEGNLNFWANYVRQSRVLKWRDEQQTGVTLRNPDRSYFVFGGDATDKGFGDLKFARQLVELKLAFPDRVFLLIGNRDINKIKLSSELHESDLRRRAADIPGPYWVDKNQVTLVDHLQREYGTDGDVEQWNTGVNRLKWLLVHTMGCPKSFEFRRQEVADDRGVSPADVSDEDVLSSFQQSVEPDGVLSQYLSVAQMGVVLGDALFVHGGVNEHCLGFVPSSVNQDYRKTDVPGLETKHTHTVQDWITMLNSWAVHSLQEWNEQRRWDASREHRGGSSVMGYFYTAAVGRKSAGNPSYLVKGQPVPPQNVSELLLKSGIRKVVSGHKPWGSSPMLLKHDGVEFIDADTSYSDPSAADKRGKAVSEVLLECIGSGETHTILHGVAHDGAEYDVNASQDPWVGRDVDGWLVKARVADGSYLLSQATGYDVNYCRKTSQELGGVSR